MRFRKSYLSCLTVSSIALSFALTSTHAIAQSPVNAMPSQPAALMDMVAQRNTLEDASLKPWRLVIRVRSEAKPGGNKSGASGDAVGKEIRIEEIWASPNRYKISYQLQDQAWQVYGADTDQKMVGEAGKPDFWSRALREFVNPIPGDKARAHWTLELKEQTFGNAKMKCLYVTGYEGKGDQKPGSGPTYCIDADKPYLRVSAPPLSQVQTLRNGLRTFQGQYVPERVERSQSGSTLWKAELETLELQAQVDEAVLTAPPDAKPVVRVMPISSVVAQGLLVSKAPPSYPEVARARRVQGIVVLQAVIGKDGKLSDIQVVSGPVELQDAAIDSVKQWKYKPYLLNGEPVAVETTINIIFQMH